MNYRPITSPEEIPERFVSGWNNRDVDELVSVFTEDAEFVHLNFAKTYSRLSPSNSMGNGSVCLLIILI